MNAKLVDSIKQGLNIRASVLVRNIAKVLKHYERLRNISLQLIRNITKISNHNERLRNNTLLGLSCWSNPNDDTSSVLSFELTIRGFVPFYTAKFLFRTREFTLFEASEGVTRAKKHAPLSSTSHSAEISSSSSSPTSSDRWKTWIAQSLIEGQSWLDLLIRINSYSVIR